MYKKILYLTFFFVTSLFSMERTLIEESASFPWQDLSGELRYKTIEYAYPWKIDKQSPQTLAESLIDSVKQYNSIPKTFSKDFYYYIKYSYDKFLEKNLNENDFTILNQYILEILKPELLSKDFYLLVRLITKLNKLNKNVKEEIDHWFINIKGKIDKWLIGINDQTQNLQELIKANADVNVKDEKGKTALRWAAGKGYKNIAKLLIDAKADIDVKDEQGNTALLLAAEKGYKGIVQLLMDSGADLSIKNKYGRTALEVAKNFKQIEVANLIKAKMKQEKQSRTISKSCSVM